MLLPPFKVANLLLLWLASLPEPLFPTELMPDLLASLEAGSCAERLAGVRAVLKQVRPPPLSWGLRAAALYWVDC